MIFRLKKEEVTLDLVSHLLLLRPNYEA